MAKVVEVIISDECTSGRGTEESPMRTILHLFTLDGKPICSHDPGGGLAKEQGHVHAEALVQLLRQDGPRA